jgi:hypothetical protein
MLSDTPSPYSIFPSMDVGFAVTVGTLDESLRWTFGTGWSFVVGATLGAFVGALDGSVADPGAPDVDGPAVVEPGCGAASWSGSPEQPATAKIKARHALRHALRT